MVAAGPTRAGAGREPGGRRRRAEPVDRRYDASDHPAQGGTTTIPGSGTVAHRTGGPPAPGASRRGPLAVGDGRIVALVVAIIAGYAVLALVLPHPYPSYDEAKYLAIGRNALRGLGPITDFGDAFLTHPPFYAMILAAPQVALGIDPWPWGYLLNAVAGAAMVAMVGRLAWRYGPWASAATVALLAGWLYLFDLARTARLDVPQAALTLAYLLVASSAIERGSVRRAVLAGVVFGWAFLVKESALALAGVPFVVAIARRRPIGQTIRTAGWAALVALPLVSWWFVWYAAHTGRIFVVGIRSGLQPLLAGALVLVALILIAAGSLGGGASLRARIDAWLAPRSAAILTAVVLGAAWAVGFGVAFARSSVIAGMSLIDLPRLLAYGRAWALDVAPVAVAGIGALPAMWLAWRGDDGPLEPLLGVLMGTSWLLFAAALGEPPRNDLAVLGLLVAASVGGWVWVLREAAAGRPIASALAVIAGVGAGVTLAGLLGRAGVARRITGTSAGWIAFGILGGVAVGAVLALRGRLVRRMDPSRGLAAIAVGLVIVLSLGLLSTYAARAAVAGTPTIRDRASRDIATWLEGHVPAGTTIAFGSVEANEAALLLDGRYPLRHLAATIGTVSPAAPLGILLHGTTPVDDVIVADPHPREDALLVFTASMVREKLVDLGCDYIVYVTGISTATPTMVDWLATVPGIGEAYRAEATSGATTLVIHIYSVDHAALAIPADHLFASAAAVDRMLGELRGSAALPAIAGRLVDRLVLPDTAAGQAALAAVQAAAGR